MHEKDPFGDKLKDKERAEEDLYFAKRDRELLEKLRGGDESRRQDELRQVARGRCPRDGEPLAHHSIDGVEVDECAACHGIWLEKGELEALSRRESEGWLGKLFRHSLVQAR